MKIIKVEIPENSLLKTNNISYDYADSFQGSFSNEFHNPDITEIGKSFFL